MEKIRTILTDDHTLFCEGLAKLLTETQKFEVVGTYYNGKALLDNIEKEKPDLLILDIDMQDFSGIDLIQRIKTFYTIKIVMLTMHEENFYVEEAFKQGADGYLSKSVESSYLIESLTMIASGVKVFPDLKKIPTTNQSPLSERELQILRELIRGKTSEEIAQEFNLSQLTVKTHRRNMMKKLKVTNSAELISTAFKRGLI